MQRIRIKCLSKTGTFIQDVEFKTDFVPRVGEIIDLKSYHKWEKDVTTFFVNEVTYSVEDGGLIPELECQQWWKGDRQEQLQLLGWIK